MKIFRGDSDPSSIRQLMFTVQTAAGLYTTLINSGNPLALSQNGFVQSIQSHSRGGWNTSHFLSFSRNITIAEQFAVGQSGKTLGISTQNSWDTLIATIDLSKLTLVNNLSVGIDHYSFPELNKSQQLIQLGILHKIGFDIGYDERRKAGMPLTRNILVIDVPKLLNDLISKGQVICQTALANATHEEEVLVLPIDPFHGGGFTAQLDLGCINDPIDFFNLI